MSKKYFYTACITSILCLCSFISLENPLLSLVKIDGGTFMMGSKDDTKIAENDEQKQHEVKVNSFELNQLEVTVWEWKQYCKKTNTKLPKTPSWGWKDNYPITNVTWYDVIKYCNWLSKQDGLKPTYKFAGPLVVCDFNANGYRLPTEAEWEYAAKGGNKSKNTFFAGSNDSNEVAWHAKNSDKRPHSVGTKLPNELGIHDMSGNVWEWCWDWYNKDYYKTEDGNNPKGPIRGEKKSVRGGSWDSQESYLRTANRISTLPDVTNEFYGFRLAKSIL